MLRSILGFELLFRNIEVCENSSFMREAYLKIGNANI